MKLFSHPVLKFRTKDRLHISQEPGLLSWVALFSINVLGIIVDYYAIPDHFLLHAGFLSLCLILSLNLMKTWDLIMDKEENLGTMIHRNWYHVFSIRVPEENVERFPLNAITYVALTSGSVVEIFRRKGSSTKIVSDSSNYSLLKNLRKEISTFLCLERIEYLKDSDKIFFEWDVDPWITTLGNSESQESDNETQESNPTQEESQFQVAVSGRQSGICSPDGPSQQPPDCSDLSDGIRPKLSPPAASTDAPNNLGVADILERNEFLGKSAFLLLKAKKNQFRSTRKYFFK